MKSKLLNSILFIFISFLVSCGGGGGNEGDEAVSEDNQTDNNFIGNTVPIGLSSFAIGVPSFPVEEYKSAVADIKNVATNELYIFPENSDRDQIFNALKSMVDDGYKVLHQIHILNGPGMRKSTDRWINRVVGKKISDTEFIRLLQSNPTVKGAVDSLFAQVVAEARRLESIGVEVIICPELEDNHSHNNTYDILLSSLYKAGWTDKSKIVRNTYKGQHTSGLRKEIHPRSLSEIKKHNLKAGDIVNNDGVNLGQISIDEMKSMAKYCQDNGIIFYLWIAELQGLKHKKGGQPWDMEVVGQYDKRSYTIPSPADYIDILMFGLNMEPVVEKSEFIISKFLWKPKAESAYNKGKLVIHVDACEAVVVVNGESLPDYGPGNGRCNTSRSQKTACSYGLNVKVQVFDIKTNKPYMTSDGKDRVTIPNGCNRLEIP